MIVPPFWSIPVRAPTAPVDDEVAAPDRGAGERARVLLDPTTPDIMFSHTDQPTRPVDHDLGSVDQAEPEVARGSPSNVIRHRCRIPTPIECLAPGLRTVTSRIPCS